MVSCASVVVVVVLDVEDGFNVVPGVVTSGEPVTAVSFATVELPGKRMCLCG